MQPSRLIASTVSVVLACSTARAAAPTGQYTVQAAAGTVKDNTSGLTWQRAHSASTLSWDAANTYCATLVLGGFANGWRLPTKFELETIVDWQLKNPAIDLDAFPNTKPETFWTSTVSASSGANYWSVSFYSGYTNAPSSSTNSNWARCVRAG